MIVALLKFWLRGRPVYLTDWLEAPTELKVWVFDKLGWHSGVHATCPAWCACGVDFGLDEDDLDDCPDVELLEAA